MERRGSSRLRRSGAAPKEEDYEVNAREDGMGDEDEDEEDGRGCEAAIARMEDGEAGAAMGRGARGGADSWGGGRGADGQGRNQ